jgi:hypothetical protein
MWSTDDVHTMTHSRLSLTELHQVLLVAVATSGIRHNLRNKLASLRNATFFLERKPVWRDDMRVPRFFDIIDSELAAADQVTASGMSEVLREPQPEPVDLASVVGAALEVLDDGGGFVDGDPAPWLRPCATSKPGRLGLGISVARRVASRAGGTLEVTAADRGARATIAVPLHKGW